MSEPAALTAQSFSHADNLGYLGQEAVARAVGRNVNYRIVGGHMARLLLLVYPTPAATPRSTTDADTAVDDVHVIGPIVDDLRSQNFTQIACNVFTKAIAEGQHIEINVLLSRLNNSNRGIQSQDIADVGQVDTLPELSFALNAPGLDLDVSAVLTDGRTIRYRTRIPDVEAAVVLKAHSWQARGIQTERDLADLHSLLEIREAHPGTDWALSNAGLKGFRRDAAQTLYDLATSLGKRSSHLPVPAYLDRTRMQALISKHVARPGR